jgi:hypothetical protein
MGMTGIGAWGASGLMGLDIEKRVKD